MTASATRGFGILEQWLARRRYNRAQAIMAGLKARGRILDIGCGNPPLFLKLIDFKKKFGLDSNLDPASAAQNEPGKIEACCFDILKHTHMPFEDNFFDCVTMLAFIEHIPAEHMHAISSELHRIIKPNGMLLITTPTPWAHRLLRFMAVLHLVSSIEIENHCAIYSSAKLRALLTNAGFKKESITSGTFELGGNLWIRAVK